MNLRKKRERIHNRTISTSDRKNNNSKISKRRKITEGMKIPAISENARWTLRLSLLIAEVWKLDFSLLTAITIFPAELQESEAKVECELCVC